MAGVGQSWTAMQSKQAAVVVKSSSSSKPQNSKRLVGGSRSKGGSWRGRAKLRTAGAGATQNNAAVVAPRQWRATSRVESKRDTPAGAARRLRARRRRKTRIDREEKMAEEKTATSWRWGAGEKAARMPCRSRYQGLATPKEPPHGPLKQVRWQGAGGTSLRRGVLSCEVPRTSWCRFKTKRGPLAGC